MLCIDDLRKSATLSLMMYDIVLATRHRVCE